ncbi:MAG: methionine--tRNA ligase [Candidatus Vogelbacteria bacterium]|nr:methionine--tRNA ligase [Candidatus Vogelbacteria bacterium]
MTINYDEFKKTELKVAQIKSATRVDGSDKLLQLIVDAGDQDEAGQALDRQIIAGIGKAYEPETLIGKQIIIVANLEPRKLMGLESQGMLLAANSEAGPIIITTEHDSLPGANIQ